MSPHAKAQWVRLLDVVAIGPLMSYGGWRLRQEEPLVGTGLIVLGVLTVLYNGRNLIRIEHERRQLLQGTAPTSTNVLSPTPGVSQQELSQAAAAVPVMVG